MTELSPTARLATCVRCAEERAAAATESSVLARRALKTSGRRLLGAAKVAEWLSALPRVETPTLVDTRALGMVRNGSVVFEPLEVPRQKGFAR